ncbi:MAG: hypothetical protein JW807_12030 [Spirochaetes bacterium]|nr:hypothetical protein [Spirochaetota bacterium]
MEESFDDKTGYCRSLGHYVPFQYCRTVNSGLPCSKIKDCWFEKLDIERFIGENYSKSEIEQIFTPRPEKISTLIDLINKAKDNK